MVPVAPGGKPVGCHEKGEVMVIWLQEAFNFTEEFAFDILIY